MARHLPLPETPLVQELRAEGLNPREIRRILNRGKHLQSLVKSLPTQALQDWTITQLIQEIGKRPNADKISPLLSMVVGLWDRAEQDNVAAKLLMDRLEPVKQTVTVEISGEALAMFDLATDTVADVFQDDPRVEEWLLLFQRRANALRPTVSLSVPASDNEPGD